MTTTLIALLRGINVGRAKRIAMADLRKLVGSLGFTEVRTLLNSGNVVFETSGRATGDAGTRMERALTDRLGISSKVIVLAAEELAEIVKEYPHGRIATNPSRSMIAICATPADAKSLTPLAARSWKPEALSLGRRVAYVWCPDGIIESPLSKEIARTLGDRVTVRNWATIGKLHALAQEE